MPHLPDDEPSDALSEPDEGPLRHGPVRTCIATRERHPVGELIRFVAGPDGAVVPDLKRKLPGRGVWVSANRPAIEAAIRKKGFARALKADARADASLADLIDTLLERDALQALSLANKAGAVTVGHAKVEAAIESGAVSAIFHASDAAADGIRKIGQAIRRRFGDRTGPEVIAPFTSTQMSLCLGREHVIHLALANTPAGEPALAKSRLFLRYRALPAMPGDAMPDGALGAATAGPGLKFVKDAEVLAAQGRTSEARSSDHALDRVPTVGPGDSLK